MRTFYCILLTNSTPFSWWNIHLLYNWLLNDERFCTFLLDMWISIFVNQKLAKQCLFWTDAILLKAHFAPEQTEQSCYVLCCYICLSRRIQPSTHEGNTHEISGCWFRQLVHSYPESVKIYCFIWREFRKPGKLV